MAVIEISDVNELQAIENDLSADYMLVNDIDTSGTSSWNGGAGFEPIGKTWDNAFTGRFFGKEYTISGLFIDRPTEDYIGLFGVIYENNCRIFDVKLDSIDYTGNGDVGGLVGWARSTTEVYNCHTSGTITGVMNGGSNFGGCIGDNDANVIRCSSNVNLSTYNFWTAGFVGWNEGQILNSYATGSVTQLDVDEGKYAGFVGRFEGGQVLKCYSNGLVSAEDADCGGFSSGGLGSASNVKDCFWDIETSGKDFTSKGATGKTTAEMQDISTYNDTATTGLDNVWDIATDVNWTDEIWSINDGNDYPKLKLPSRQVPDVVGETESGAETLIEDEHLFVGTKDQDFEQNTPGGEVIVQSPTANTWVVAGSEVDVTISVDGVYVNINGTAVHCPVYVNVNGTAELADVQKN